MVIIIVDKQHITLLFIILPSYLHLRVDLLYHLGKRNNI